MIPTDAQIAAGLKAVWRVKNDPTKPSFTRDPTPYVRAIYQAMTADHLLPAPTIGAAKSKTTHGRTR